MSGRVDEFAVWAPCMVHAGRYGGSWIEVEAVYRSVHAGLWRSLLSYTGDAELASDAEAEAFAQVPRRGNAVDDVEA